MSINKVRGRGEHPTCQRSIGKNNDNQTMIFLVVVVFNKGGILEDYA
jgi:hypothetical protein